jgi:hypothetical protein
LVDLDGDGRTDVLSGSWPGEIYFFRRAADGRFAAGQQLKDRSGKVLNVGSAAAACAVDWDGNGTLDLLVGTVLGEVHLIPNEGPEKDLAFGRPRRLEAAGQPIQVERDAGPVAADWDGDGRLDLLVGAETGSVTWYRNAGSAGQPQLEAARTLVGKSPLGWGDDDRRRPGDWGLRVKPCVVDWDGDGRLDLLLGDRCGGFLAKPSQTEQEKAEELRANDRLPGLRQKWAAAYRDYRRLLDAPAAETPQAEAERARQLETLREALRRTKDEIVVVQDIQSHYRPAHQSHGFVWLFRRQPAGLSTPKGP